jgi:hypothetical protein
MQGRFQRGAHPSPPPLKLEKIRFVWRKIVIFHTKYLNILASPSTIGKNMIFWRKIVIFHTKYPKMFAPPSARCNYLSAPLPLTWNPGSAPEMSAVVHQDKLYNWYLLFSAAHAALIHKNRNLLASYQENASEWASHIHKNCCFHLSVLVYYKANTIIIDRQLEIAVNSSVGVKHQSFYTWCTYNYWTSSGHPVFSFVYFLFQWFRTVDEGLPKMITVRVACHWWRST